MHLAEYFLLMEYKSLGATQISLCLRRLMIVLLALQIGGINSILLPAAEITQKTLPIGIVQGRVTEKTTSVRFKSPMENQRVLIQGVVYQRLLTPQRNGKASFGFFMQNLPENSDHDPKTSDGIYIHWTIGLDSEIPSNWPEPGNQIILEGFVTEEYGQTQLENLNIIRRSKGGSSLLRKLSAFKANPPDEQSTADLYWEQREGMRCIVPKGSMTTSGNKVFSGNSESLLWLIPPNQNPVLQRSDPWARRVFRDPHPLDDHPNSLRDNDNAYRLTLSSLGLKGNFSDRDRLIDPARTFSRLENNVFGAVGYTYNQYRIFIGEPAKFSKGISPAENHTPKTPIEDHVSIATYNMENLYDYRDDPMDPCDFNGNPGITGLRPPFNYVPQDYNTYQRKISGLARQIIGPLKSPDIIMVQEIEDQDIISSLQDLTAAILNRHGPRYESTGINGSGDVRGICNAFLFRVDRVKLSNRKRILDTLKNSTEFQVKPIQTNTQTAFPESMASVNGTINKSQTLARSCLLAIFEPLVNRGETSQILLLNNHFKSVPNRSVELRRQQATLNAGLIRIITETDPEIGIVMGGDLNVFPRPDDPFFNPPSDQLGSIYKEGMFNLYEFLAATKPENAYSYIYQGQAQTLDHLFINTILKSRLIDASGAHINSDWPKASDTQALYGWSDHDPIIAYFRI